MNRCLISLGRVAGALMWLFIAARCAPAEPPEMAVIRPDLQTGFANAGWKYDRYRDLPSLDANKAMLVADLKGPGIIRHIHTTRHQPKELAARGVVLEIWFDDATQPAVQCPLADFFGDGCNGQSMYFTFSWGFQQTFAGLRAGMILVKPDLPCMLSIYRFHDHQPIRFGKSLRWHINWSQEKHMFNNKEWMPKLEDAVAKGGCWVDYATVHYWYQTVPGGYRHQPLPPVAERARPMLRERAQVRRPVSFTKRRSIMASGRGRIEGGDGRAKGQRFGCGCRGSISSPLQE